MTDTGIETATGKSATIQFNGRLCIHARRCVLSQPTVFKANVEGPWIDPDAASAEALMYVALNCPSGAIRVSRHDGGANEISPMVNTILVRENGPLAINAEIVVAGAPIGTRATLCRCGESKNKPYCDSSHIARRVRGHRRADHDRERGARQARRRIVHNPLSQRTARCRRPGRDHFRNRTHGESRREDCTLPLRPFEQQALLRRHTRQSWVRRAVERGLRKKEAFQC